MERRRIASIYDRRIRTSLVPEVANIFQYYQRAIIIAIVIIFFDFVKFRHDRYLSSSIFEISSNRGGFVVAASAISSSPCSASIRRKCCCKNGVRSEPSNNAAGLASDEPSHHCKSNRNNGAGSISLISLVSASIACNSKIVAWLESGIGC